VGSERVVNVQLVLGPSEETVTVASQAATVDLATSQTGAVNGGEVVRNSHSTGATGPHSQHCNRRFPSSGPKMPQPLTTHAETGGLGR